MSSRGTVLVTGASGFIAKHVVSQLLNAGYEVRGSVRSAPRSQEIVDAVRPSLVDADNLQARLSFVELDLERDAGWNRAMKGVSAMLHMASPFPLQQPSNADEVIRPAVDGTLRALNAAHATGVKRVVITSSVAAIMHKELVADRDVLDERDWSDLSGPRATPYVKSKTLAEQAAWEFVRKQAPEIELTSINPVLVLGPPLDAHFGTSLKVVRRLLRAKDPMLPNIGFATVDVRDIAAMHVKALDNPGTIGQRLIGGDQFLWFSDMAKVLKDAYPERRIVTRKAPNAIIKILAVFDKSIRTILPELDRPVKITCNRARTTFAMDFIDARDSLRASADYLVRNGLL